MACRYVISLSSYAFSVTSKFLSHFYLRLLGDSLIFLHRCGGSNNQVTRDNFVSVIMVKIMTIPVKVQPEKQNQWICHRDLAYAIMGLVKAVVSASEIYRAGSQKGKITGGTMPTTVTQNPITMIWNWYPCFWPWYQGYPVRALRHRVKHTDLAQEEPEEGKSILGLAAASSRWISRSSITYVNYKMALLHFHPPNLPRIFPVSLKYATKRILGNVIQFSQTDTSQSHHHNQ